MFSYFTAPIVIVLSIIQSVPSLVNSAVPIWLNCSSRHLRLQFSVELELLFCLNICLNCATKYFQIQQNVPTPLARSLLGFKVIRSYRYNCTCWRYIYIDSITLSLSVTSLYGLIQITFSLCSCKLHGVRQQNQHKQMIHCCHLHVVSLK